MFLHKLTLLAASAAFCTGVLAQTSSPASPSHPSVGSGASPGGIPPSATTPGGATPSPGTGGPSTPGVRAPTVPGPRGAPEFGSVDLDRDGHLSRSEASRAGLGGQFTVLDKNNDGRIDRSEFAAHRGENGRAPGMQSGTSPSGGTRTQ
jgi:hypothetical protein